MNKTVEYRLLTFKYAYQAPDGNLTSLWSQCSPQSLCTGILSRGKMLSVHCILEILDDVIIPKKCPHFTRSRDTAEHLMSFHSISP